MKILCKCGNTMSGQRERCSSCGRRAGEMTKLIRKLPVGKKLGAWEVIETRLVQSLCRCSCGNVVLVNNSHLLSGASSQCRRCGYDSPKHGRAKTGLDVLTHSRLQSKVKSAIGRCTNPEHRLWKYYGGRGIAVYQPWIDDPLEFVKYLATLPGYDDPDLWIDRIDNNAGYEPENLRFVTSKKSAFNRRLPQRLT